jgi:3-hydroxyisobutyrate dehydrogenase-like beta-hydroxyacid dehydrogenase
MIRSSLEKGSQFVTSTIGILGTGDMGSAVGRQFRLGGYRVVTALDERSALSQALSREAGLEDLGALERVVAECDVFLSILPPAAAPAFAARSAELIRAAGRTLIYADCNAVAPATVQAIATSFDDSGAHFVDVGIVGPAPQDGATIPTRFYVSGDARELLLESVVPGIEMVDMGDRIGRASALKMCYAAMNKGTNALYTNLLLAARRLGVLEELMLEFESSQPEAARRMARRLPFLASAAGRFTGEMAEIAATFDAAGVSGDFYRGAEWLYALLARSELGSEARANQPAERSLTAALEVFAAALEESGDA